MNSKITHNTQIDATYNLVLFSTIGFIFIWTCAARVILPVYELELLWLDLPVVLFAIHLILLPSRLKYEIKGKTLICKNALFTKRIEIDKIQKIRRSRGWSNFGFQFASGTRGVRIYHGTLNRTFITPENGKELIQALKDINPEIK